MCERIYSHMDFPIWAHHVHVAIYRVSCKAVLHSFKRRVRNIHHFEIHRRNSFVMRDLNIAHYTIAIVQNLRLFQHGFKNTVKRLVQRELIRHLKMDFSFFDLAPKTMEAKRTMYKFPMNFRVEVKDLGPNHPTWATNAEAVPQELAVAIPPGFNGPGGGYSPEDFFALAMANCFAATFRVIAEKSAVTYQTLDIACNLEVDLNENGKPWMARAHLDVKLSKPSNTERAGRLLEKVSGQCLIHQSVKTETTYSFEVIA